MVNGQYLRKAVAVITVLACVTGMIGCQSTPVRSEEGISSESGTTPPASSQETEEIDSWKKESYQEIVFEEDRISTNSYGVTVDGTTVTITNGGTYVLSGVLRDGRIVVDASKNDKVILVWNGAEIFCEKASPVYVVQADKTIFYLADGTTNVISDGATYSFANGETEPDATVFAKDDLTIKGTGSLTVNANYYDGIVCKNDLKITGGVLTVNAVHQGIKGKDSLTVQGGTILVNAGDDGIKSSNEALVEDDGKEVGWVLIEDGTITIAAGDDAIHAESDLTVNGGNITITESYEGLEGACIYINGGAISLYASDDGINAAGYAVAGAFSGTADGQPDGKHLQNEMDRDAEKNGNKDGNKNGNENRSINGNKNGNENWNINGNENWNGDGIPNENGSDPAGRGADKNNPEAGITERAAFEKDGNYFGGRGNMGAMGGASSGGYLEINGGTVYVNADGDGIDVNGSIVMNGGVVQVDGTERYGDGTLDYDHTFEINGGVLIGIGNSAMAQTVTSGSTQSCMVFYLDTMREAGSVITVQDTSGAEILSYTPQKSYNFFTFSSDKLKMGDTYAVWIDGIEEQSLVLSDVITTSGNVSGIGGFGGKNHGRMPERETGMN